MVSRVMAPAFGCAATVATAAAASAVSSAAAAVFVAAEAEGGTGLPAELRGGEGGVYGAQLLRGVCEEADGALAGQAILRDGERGRGSRWWAHLKGGQKEGRRMDTAALVCAHKSVWAPVRQQSSAGAREVSMGCSCSGVRKTKRGACRPGPC